ncbi:hypothetical protein [Limnohabitans sp. 2KL-51]|uniref:hypothetical protein n=1 Tax=Limnohabitans sp. 2KL-51 TaxID=1977911 RepID=UPI000D3461A2|nr:hypothetical protein [Limnohabitans sp. 2KL-51]PUE47689.1 hypothetical protein B9Z49_10015 [Limnohabitans sp. 2KL-51]
MLALLNSPRPAWLRISAAVLACALASGAAAQSPSPAELAAKALASAPVQALLNAQAQSAKAAQNNPQKEYDAQLAAIRQAILEATLDRPTRVVSTAWVDDKGALHESAHFHSEAQVRGVRVLSYVQGDEPVTQVSAEVLPWGWKPVGADQSCKAPPRPWRLPLGVQVVMPEGFSGPQLFASQTLVGLAQQAWSQNMQVSQRWRTHNVTQVAPQLDNAYMRALTGQTEERSGWMAEISLQPHAPAEARSWTDRLSLNQSAPPLRWTLSLRLGQKLSPASRLVPQWQIEQIISVAPLALSHSPTAWAQQMQGLLQERMRQWVAQLDKQTECEPVQFHVRRQGTQSLELQAGFDSGLRPGDRVLLMDPAHVPARMLEPGVAQHLALAQVVKVGSHRTELQQLAGPALASHGAWMALPL